MKEISVAELNNLRKDSTEEFDLIDVREPYEFEIADIGGQKLPLSELSDRISELEGKEKSKLVVMCRSGGRSAKVVNYLESMGFEEVYNLKGGILAWSKEIDNSVPSY